MAFFSVPYVCRTLTRTFARSFFFAPDIVVTRNARFATPAVFAVYDKVISTSTFALVRIHPRSDRLELPQRYFKYTPRHAPCMPRVCFFFFVGREGFL